MYMEHKNSQLLGTCKLILFIVSPVNLLREYQKFEIREFVGNK
jgi:hypothetical protein